MDWKKAKPAAFRALRASLMLEDQKFAKGADDDLKALAGQVVEYWRVVSEGQILSGHLIDMAIHRARLLCAAVGIEGQGKAQRIERIIQLFAVIGDQLIEAFDKGGTDEKDQEEQG